MERKSYINTIIIYILFIVGAVLHLWDTTFNLMLSLTPLVLLLTSIIFIIFEIKVSLTPKKFFQFILPAFFVTFLLEVSGANFNFPFGAYSYGEVLGPMIFNVPLIIGLNWVTIVISANRLLPSHYIYKPILVGLICTLFDYLLEPIAIKLNYWSWDNVNIPIFNYISWFLISTLLSHSIERFNIEIRSHYWGHLIIAQSIFFLILQNI